MNAHPLFLVVTLLYGLTLFSTCKKEDLIPPPPVDPCTATHKKTPLEKIWQHDLPNYVSSPFVSMYPIVYGNKVVYSGGYGANQKLVVADVETGDLLLEKSIDFNFESSDFQVHGDFLYYKKSANGAPIRRVSLNSDTPASDFTAFQGKTADYVSFYGNSLVAVYAQNATESITLKNTDTEAERTVFYVQGQIAPPLLWNLPNGDTVLTVLYFTAPKYHLVSLNLTSGDSLFSIAPISRPGIYFDATTFFLHNGMACLASGDYLDCYDVTSGLRRWSYQSPYNSYLLGLGTSLTAFPHGNYIVLGGKLDGTSCVSAQDGTEQWRKEIPIKTLITGTSAANPVFIDDRMFIVLTPRLPAINLGSACTDWDFTSPNLSNAGFRAGIAYHAGFKTLFVRDNGHLLAIKYQD